MVVNLSSGGVSVVQQFRASRGEAAPVSLVWKNAVYATLPVSRFNVSGAPTVVATSLSSIDAQQLAAALIQP